MMDDALHHDKHEQSEPFLRESTNVDDTNDEVENYHGITRKQAWCLYTSHCLSMWMSRTYEYAAILFIQTTFPGNLLPSSINGIAETICVLVSTTALGRWIDAAPTRLRPLLLSITANRITLIVSCVLWLLMFSITTLTFKHLVFSLLLILGMVEKSSRVANTLSMERDWIPRVAFSSPITDQEGNNDTFNLTHLNTIMRRIDVTCKFLAPTTISFFMAATSARATAACVAVISPLSMCLEIWGVMVVWKENDALKEKIHASKKSIGVESSEATLPTKTPFSTLKMSIRVFNFICSAIKDHIDSLFYYFQSKVWQPSLCVAILHGSVLAWSGTLVTWLLNADFSLAEVTVVKGIGNVFEIGSTFVFPWAVHIFYSDCLTQLNKSVTYQLVPLRENEEHYAREGNAEGSVRQIATISDKEEMYQEGGEADVSICKTALWAVCGLSVCLLPTILSLFKLDKGIEQTKSSQQGAHETPFQTSAAIAVGFFTFLSFSLLGRWTFDLAVTQLTQVMIPASHRSMFGGTEMAVVASISLIHWVAAAIWHQQSDFKWLSLGSVVAVYGATVTYVWWMRRTMRNEKRSA